MIESRETSLQQAVKEDLQALPHMKIKIIGRKEYYLPIIWLYIKLVLSLTAINFLVFNILYFSGLVVEKTYWRLSGLVVEKIHFHTYIKHLLAVNCFAVFILILMIHQFYIFYSLTAKQLKAAPFLRDFLRFIEIIFFSLYGLFSALEVLFFYFEGFALFSFIFTVLLTALIINFEAERIGFPILMDLINKYFDKNA